nr:predicted GPI-anchored protein 58 [Aegilops tauschii subsp. strangulata]
MPCVRPSPPTATQNAARRRSHLAGPAPPDCIPVSNVSSSSSSPRPTAPSLRPAVRPRPSPSLSRSPVHHAHSSTHRALGPSSPHPPRRRPRPRTGHARSSRPLASRPHALRPAPWPAPSAFLPHRRALHRDSPLPCRSSRLLPLPAMAALKCRPTTAAPVRSRSPPPGAALAPGCATAPAHTRSAYARGRASPAWPPPPCCFPRAHGRACLLRRGLARPRSSSASHAPTGRSSAPRTAAPCPSRSVPAAVSRRHAAPAPCAVTAARRCGRRRPAPFPPCRPGRVPSGRSKCPLAPNELWPLGPMTCGAPAPRTINGH